MGGGSRRMGSPKQLLHHGDSTLIEIAAAALGETVDDVVILGGGDLPESLARHPRLPDVNDTTGPMAGMLAAMRWQPRSAWIFAACDLPLLRSEAVSWLCRQRRPGRWAVLPRLGEAGVEPLLAMYEPQSRGLLEDLVARDLRAPRHIADHPRVVSPTPPEELHPQWTNANTPEELEALGRRDS